MHYLVAALLLALPFCATAQDDAKPMPASELREFLGPVSEKAFAWTKYEVEDIDVFYGHANRPLDGEVGFYLGFAPQQLEPIPDSVAIESKLGIFPVTWHRTTAKDGSTRQRALLHLDDTWWVDIWVSAKREQDMDAIVKLVSDLPTFTQKPKPIHSP